MHMSAFIAASCRPGYGAGMALWSRSGSAREEIDR
jgi:hypothetical protein